MRVLFSVNNFGFLRNFEPALRELAARGHDIHLLAERKDTLQTSFSLGHLGGLHSDKDNAALEILPETLASMAILPLQVRLVYRIGTAYGYELDQGHIKEFIAALGVGLAGQYLEHFGRKLLGGLLGSVLGGMGRAVGHQAASSGMAFATTWALGQVAKQYYGGGRTLDAEKLKAAFAPLLAQGQALVDRYGGDIAQRARSIDVRNLPALIKSA